MRGATIGGHAYIAGGYIVGACPNTLHRFDLAAGTWDTPRQMMDNPGYGATVVAHMGMLHVIGGVSTTAGCAGLDPVTQQVSALTHRLYDPTLNQWDDAAKAQLPAGDNHQGAAFGILADSKLHIVAGFNNETGNVVSSAHHVYDFTLDTWATAAPYPVAVQYPASAVLSDGRLIVSGGSTGAACVGSTFIYDSGTDMWDQTIPDAPALLQKHGGFVVGDRFHTVNGDTECVVPSVTPVPQSRHMIYDVGSKAWVQDSGATPASATAAPNALEAPVVVDRAGGAMIFSGNNGGAVISVTEYADSLFLYQKL